MCTTDPRRQPRIHQSAAPTCYADVLAHCLRQGRCQIWQGGVNNHGQPQIRRRLQLPNISGRKATVTNLAKAVWEDLHGRSVPTGHHVYHRCGNSLCMARAHLVCGTARQKSALYSSLGRLKFSLDQLIRVNQAAQARPHAKLGLAGARQVRAARGHRSAQELAREFGISTSIVYRVWRHESWIECMPAASVFHLGAHGASLTRSA